MREELKELEGTETQAAVAEIEGKQVVRPRVLGKLARDLDGELTRVLIGFQGDPICWCLIELGFGLGNSGGEILYS